MKHGNHLMPADFLAMVPKLYATEDDDNPTVWVKLFVPNGNWSWYVIEFDGDDHCFGNVVGHEAELGYFLLSDLVRVRDRFGPAIERDPFFSPRPLSVVKAWEGRKAG